MTAVSPERALKIIAGAKGRLQALARVMRQGTPRQAGMFMIT